MVPNPDLRGPGSRAVRLLGIALTAIIQACGSSDEMAPAGPPVAIAISPEQSNLTHIGDVRVLEAVATDAQGRASSLATGFTWVSSDPAIVEVVDEGSGRIVAKAAGIAEVSAEADGLTGTAMVEVIYVQSLSSGAAGGCVVLTDHGAYCWGTNKNGQLGDGTTFDRALPARVDTDVELTYAGRGDWHACGLSTDGQAYCWGFASHLGRGSISEAESLIPGPVVTGERFVQLAVGRAEQCGITGAGDVWCWGAADALPRRMDVPPAIDVTVGSANCVVTVDNDAYCWGTDPWGEIGVGAGPYPDGSFPQFQTPQLVVGGHKYRDIAAGQAHTCGVTVDGQALCWGGNRTTAPFGSDLLTGQLGDGSGVRLRTVPGPVASSENFTRISAGPSHSCGLTAQGVAWCWGNGALGDGIRRSLPAQDTPVRVTAVQPFEEISAGSPTCAVSEWREAFCWGADNGWRNSPPGTFWPAEPDRMLLPIRSN